MATQRKDRDYTFFKHTTSTCPECLGLVDTRVVIKDNKVYFKKLCPTHGPSEAMVSEDAEYYVNAYHFARAGTMPLEFSTEVSKGCPSDCGLCPDHEQHTCVPIIEVTDYCNLECPICIVDNQYSHHMSVPDFEHICDNMLKKEGKMDSIVMSGGEPTSHPRFFDLVAAGRARSPAIARVVVVTNGLRLASDRKFVEQFKKSGAYASLQLDGFEDRSHEIIRGRMGLQEVKDRALAHLKEFDIPTQLTFVAVRGVNEHEIGKAVKLLLSEDHILSLIFQPMAHTGHGGGAFKHDPMDRITIPGILGAAEKQTDGLVKKSDFVPLPCSHPQCVSLTYLLKLDDGSYVPFPRFVDMRKHLDMLRASATLEASPAFHDTMNEVLADLWSAAGEVPDVDRITGALKRAMKSMFPERQKLSREEAIRVGERQAKSIFLHAYMDRHDFDLERLRKCCHHYPQIDDRIMPACGFNMFHRGAAKGADTPRPAWGKAPFAGAVSDGEPATAESPARPEGWVGTPSAEARRRSLPIVQ